MRILAGRWAGTDLVSPSGRVRPTAEPVRALAMALVGPRLEGARVLDLFAGSGGLGIEALSRGASACDFVENGPTALHALKANVARFRIGRRARVFARDAVPWVEALARGRYDVAFADPPYGSAKLDRVVRRWLDVPFAPLLVVEHAATHTLASPARVQERIGDTVVSVLEADPARDPGPLRDRG